MTWAHANSNGSINQPSRPHALIVLNVSCNETTADEWNEGIATEKLLSSATTEIKANPTFQKYVTLWKDRGVYIDNLKELLLRYYTDVTVLRLPTKSRYNLLNAQRQTLYSIITHGCEKSHRIKANSQMLADSDDLQGYLQAAFDHFSRSLDKPFDFVAASVRNNPIPVDFPDHIVKLATAVCTIKKRYKTSEVFSGLTRMIGSCVMLDAARGNLLGKSCNSCTQALLQRLIVG